MAMNPAGPFDIPYAVSYIDMLALPSKSLCEPMKYQMLSRRPMRSTTQGRMPAISKSLLCSPSKGITDAYAKQLAQLPLTTCGRVQEQEVSTGYLSVNVSHNQAAGRNRA